MKNLSGNLVFVADNPTDSEQNARIIIKKPIIDAIYKQVLSEQMSSIQTEGFMIGATPKSYVERLYKPYIIKHLKEFFCKHGVINFLYEALRRNKITPVGEPKLTKINLDVGKDAEFIFSFSRIKLDFKKGWKKYSFKSPSRKNYRDLDKQVELFVKLEKENQEKHKSKKKIKYSDWVLFNSSVLGRKNKRLIKGHEEPLWIKVGREETDKDAHELFLEKEVGNSFITKNHFLQKYFSKQLDTKYSFSIEIVERVPHSFFSLGQFKKHFRVKNSKDMHSKLIEVFSFRNDISQRREIIEAAFKTLFKRYPIIIPDKLILEQKRLVLETVRDNPDYYVYKAQKEFKEQVRMLAEKQLTEAIVVDHIGHQENIKVSRDDVLGYLNLLQRPRTKEFVYFNLPATQFNGQEQPVPSGLINQACWREKTLNYIIAHLTK